MPDSWNGRDLAEVTVGIWQCNTYTRTVAGVRTSLQHKIARHHLAGAKALNAVAGCSVPEVALSYSRGSLRPSTKCSATAVKAGCGGCAGADKVQQVSTGHVNDAMLMLV